MTFILSKRGLLASLAMTACLAAGGAYASGFTVGGTAADAASGAVQAAGTATGAANAAGAASGTSVLGSGAAPAQAPVSAPALGGAALGGSALSGLGLPDLAGGSASNVAGVLEYCIKNNYLKNASVSGVKDSLMQKAGLSPAEPEKDAGYASGLGGMLAGGDGSNFDMSKIQDNVKERACDYVLEKAPSLL